MFNTLEPITISDRALEKIKNIMVTKNIPADYGLRVGIKGGGCGGVALALGFDKKKETDIAFTIQNLSIYVDKKHTLYIVGKEVDFYEGADAYGFMFVDPQEK